MATFRYIRLNVTNAYDNNTGLYNGDFATMGEFNLRNSGSTLSRTGWVATADSEDPSEPGQASRTLDSSTATWWHTKYSGGVDPMPHWIKIDCGSSISADTIRFTNRGSGLNGCIGAYTIETSPDDSTYSAAGSGTAQTGTPTAGAVIDLSITAGPVVNTKQIDDAITLSEARIGSALRPRSISDAVSIFEESVIRATACQINDGLSVSDTTALYKVNGRVSSDSVTITESVSKLLKLTRLVSEVVTITETLARSAYRHRRIDDLLTLYELVTPSYVPGGGGGGGTTYTRTVSDAVTVTEQLLSQAFRNAILTDALTISESVTRYALRNRITSDVVSVSDFITRQLVRSPVIADSVEITDNVIRRAWYTRLIAEALNLTENISSLYVPDGASLFEVRARVGVDNSSQAIVGFSTSGMPVLGGYS